MPVVNPLLLRPLHAVGKYSLLIFRAFSSFEDSRMLGRNTIKQMVRIGIESLPIVMLAAFFSGAVTTVQAAYQLETPLIPRSVIGSIVVPSLILELGAVVTGFILAGRVGARIAAELGTMRVTEQIDALEAMGLNSTRYLIAPRISAGVLMFPVLYVAACTVGILGGILVAKMGDFLTVEEFIKGARDFYKPFDPFFGIIKSVVFGYIITSVSCFRGYYTVGGAEGVGKSTTQAAVMSCIYILFADLVLAVTLL